jgi:PAS domain S-box-containing protein
MDPEKTRSEESSALRTDELEAELLALNKDVLERKQAVVDRQEAKEELSQANESLKSESTAREQAQSELDRVFTSTPDMMAMGGFDGFFKRVNPAMLRSTGYTEAELLTTPFHDLCHQDDLAHMRDGVSKLANGEDVQALSIRVKHKDGHYLHTEWTDVPFTDRGMFFTIGRDVTERKALEESLQRTLAAMQDAQRIGAVGNWNVDLTTGISDL